MRSKMGRIVSGPPGSVKQLTYESLTNRAETAFNVKNAKSISDEQKVLKKVRGILNKVTPEKYNVLFEDLWLQLVVDGQVDVMGIVEQVIYTVFDVALDQPKFSYLYADICYHLCRKIQMQKDESSDMSRSDSITSDDPNKPSATLKEFRRFLLNTCQARFEEGSKHQQTVLPSDADPEERDQVEKMEQRYKARSLGNIKFIAELFKRSLLSERIMHIVIRILLLDTDHTDARNIESMETLNEMLLTVGKKLDRPQTKANMDVYFEKLEEIAQVHPIKRIRFMVQNMIELRSANWVSRQEIKQTTLEEDAGRRPSAIGRTASSNWAPNGAAAAAPVRTTSYKEAAPPAKPKAAAEKDDGFKVVGRPGKAATTNAWTTVGGGQVSPHSKATPTSPIASTSKAKAPTTSASPAPAAPVKENSGPLEPEDKVPPLSDEQVTAKARGLLEEWAVDPNDTENAIAVLKEEIPAMSYTTFLMGMLLCAISQNKREKERAELPALWSLYAQEELIQPEHLQDAFVGAIQKAKRDEMWVDVPRLWKNVGGVLCACLGEKVIELDVLTPMCEVLANDEDYPDLPAEMLKGVTESMKQEDVDVFDADKMGGVLASLSKKKKKFKVESIEEFEEALEQVFS